MIQLGKFYSYTVADESKSFYCPDCIITNDVEITSADYASLKINSERDE
jgi:acetone carboxylase gamma subunit